MFNEHQPILLNFPLKGEWSLPNTPGTRIPSHGTNILGTRYAYDFLQVDFHRKGKPCYEVSFLHYLLFGVAVKQCYCYGKDIYAPCDGEVVAIEDTCHERKRAYLLTDVLRARKYSKTHIHSGNVKAIAGNYLIIKHREGVYVACCHIQPDSIKVSIGQTIKTGDKLACIGHTGNSMFPHLHFQMMDCIDMKQAKGVLCAFQCYEVKTKDGWIERQNSIPKASKRIRYMKSEHP